MIDGNQLREEFGRYLAEHKATRWGMDAALMHVCKIAYDAGKADGPGAVLHSREYEIEVPEPDIKAHLLYCSAPKTAFRTVWKDGIDVEVPAHWVEHFCRRYGDAREAAGYARGLAEAGDRIRRGRKILDAALRGEVKP